MFQTALVFLQFLEWGLSHPFIPNSHAHRREELSVVHFVLLSVRSCAFLQLLHMLYLRSCFWPKSTEAGGAMCDTKWGFNTNYGHRTLPFKWQSSNGFHFYEDKAVGSFSVCVCGLIIRANSFVTPSPYVWRFPRLLPIIDCFFFLYFTQLYNIYLPKF